MPGERIAAACALATTLQWCPLSCSSGEGLVIFESSVKDPRDYEFRLRAVSSRYCETVPRDSRAASVEFRAYSKLREGDSVSLVIAASLLDPRRFSGRARAICTGATAAARVT